MKRHSSHPSLALENVRREIHRAGTITLDKMDVLVSAFRENDSAKLDEVARRDREVDSLDAERVAYLGRIRQARFNRGNVRRPGPGDQWAPVGEWARYR